MRGIPLARASQRAYRASAGTVSAPWACVAVAGGNSGRPSALASARSYHRVNAGNLLVPTVREMPADAVSESHKLMLKAGLIRSSASGIYSLLPLGLRSLEKIEKIIDEEMGAIGGMKVALPLLAPASLWKTVGRWDSTGQELFRLKDRKDTSFCLAPTHEEAVTELVADLVNSYRQLPLRLYQMDRKFRDEARPRAGLMRGREFWMKDMYTFDVSNNDAFATYAHVARAYKRIFKRLDLKFVQALADTGNIGGLQSDEFHILSSTGEDTLLTCARCGYAANREVGEEGYHLDPYAKAGADPLTGLNITTSAVLVRSKNGGNPFYVPLMHREERPPTEIKLKREATRLELEYSGTIVTGQRAIEVVREDADKRAQVAGIKASEMKTPLLMERQIAMRPNVADILSKKFVGDTGVALVDNAIKMVDSGEAKEGDPCPMCDAHLGEEKGIEIGHAFVLGTKYSAPLKATISTKDGTTHPIEMGCYGLGVSRMLAGVVETHRDSKGIVWPESIAPYRMCIVTMHVEPPGSDEQLYALAEDLYDRLDALPGFTNEIVLDTRDLRPGQKLSQMSLVGYPWCVIVGSRTLSEGTVEVEYRITGEKKTMPLEQLVAHFTAL
eukprot:Opistho-2@86259